MVKLTDKFIDTTSTEYKIAQFKGKRGYVFEYDEDDNRKLIPRGIHLVEKNGNTVFLTIADIVTWLFVEMDIKEEEEKMKKKKAKKK
jgi:hypothetical protein